MTHSLRLVTEQFPASTMMARKDFAKVQNKKLIEPVHWFTDGDNEYYNLFMGIGWPQRITERADQLPGYSCMVGVEKSAQIAAESAKFIVLDEIEEFSVTQLLSASVEMRGLWGFGLHKRFLRVFYGDHRTFELTVANYNGRLIEDDGNDLNAVIVSPPDDYDTPQAFDIFLRRLEDVLSEKNKRLNLGNADIIRNRILSFTRNDPAIMALGGLMHVLLMRTPWMESLDSGVFGVDF